MFDCKYCSLQFNTEPEFIVHSVKCCTKVYRETCEALGALRLEIDRICKICDKLEEPVDKPVTMTSQSTSQEVKQTSSRKRSFSETKTERDTATQSESGTETSSLPSKICRSSDKDIIDIETGQKSATDSKICDAEKETSAKVDCVFCDQTFQSLDELRNHIIQCCKTVKK